MSPPRRCMATLETDRIAAAIGDRYAIEDVLGHGSSATVFLALDRRHHRRVALKVLSAAVGENLGVERFQREILTVARLQHPNILPLFDSGVAAGRLWYTMPFVRTGSLRDRLERQGPLSVDEAVQLASELGDALTYAHTQGVIHRDIKPENIMFSPDGHALLADFGLARAIDDAAEPAVTGAGIVVGTPLYMSPEQASGEGPVDARSDICALGAVVFEALTGRPPFEGTSARIVMTRRLLEPPPSARALRPDLPKPVDLALLRAMARRPEERFGSASEFGAALAGGRTDGPTAGRPASRRRLLLIAAGTAVTALLGLIALVRFWPSGGRAVGSSVPVLAVLPFKNLGPAEDQYFADGLTEEITSRLAGLSGLRVISRTSADQYRNTTKTLRQIGGELGAAYVLEGSVRWERTPGEPGRIRVTPQLIRTADDGHLWTDRYDAELGRVFEVQTEIAEQVTAALNVALGTPERNALAAGGTTNAEAYDYYLRANDYLSRGYGQGTLTTARELYEQAVARDPRFALALARLSLAHMQTYWLGYERTDARLALAKAAADSALALVPDLAEGRMALGYYQYRGFRDYDRALEHFNVARRRQPSNELVLAGIAAVERRRGNWDRAIAGFEEALRYDPRSNLRAYDLGSALSMTHRYPEAERQLDRAIALAPDWANPYAEKAQLYLAWRGDLARARATFGQALDRMGLAQLGPAIQANDQTVSSALTSDSAFFPALDALTLEGFAGDTLRYHFLKAEGARFRGRTATERAYADSARVILERRLRAAPDDAYHMSWLALAYAYLGRRAEATRAAQRSAELLPIARDALAGPYVVVAQARVHMMVGDPERAVELLEPLLRIPSPITREALRADPAWAPLRQHPRFQQLVAEVQAPAQ
ncbi:MAG TPA: protein kinase [Gemmatimonadales bacterium]|nr:protein kinase [Gemmatimonadales bacterium]